MSALQRAATAKKRQPLDGIWQAVIAENASDQGDRVTVTIPSFAPDLEWGPCRWMARDGVSVPHVGDRALVAFDENQHPTIIFWEPVSF